jgi:hypothetical protein
MSSWFWISGAWRELIFILLEFLGFKRAAPSSAIFISSLRALEDQSELSKMFLLTCLTSVYALNPTGTWFESNWTLFCEFSLNFWKTVQTSIFSKTRFSLEIEVGLELYNVYMISKNGCDWFHQVLNSSALKMEIFVKSEKERRTLWFLWFRRNWPVRLNCMPYCIHMWLRGMLSWGVGTCLLGFGSIAQLFIMLWFWETNLLKMVFKSRLFYVSLWIVDIIYVKMFDDVYMWDNYVLIDCGCCRWLYICQVVVNCCRLHIY